MQGTTFPPNQEHYIEMPSQMIYEKSCQNHFQNLRSEHVYLEFITFIISVSGLYFRHNWRTLRLVREI